MYRHYRFDWSLQFSDQSLSQPIAGERMHNMEVKRGERQTVIAHENFMSLRSQSCSIDERESVTYTYCPEIAASITAAEI